MAESLEMIIAARTADIGGAAVRRLLPSAKKRMIGPFIFLDHMGPAVLTPEAHDVRPHPHIGLSTVTYLFEGEILHRDSLGTFQAIHPGDVNWMTSGRGITHSERFAPEFKARHGRLHGLQIWIALPKVHEETDPGFDHYPKATLPEFEIPGFKVRLIAGEAFGRVSPVRTHSRLFYLDFNAEAQARLSVPNVAEERGLYVVEGAVRIEDEVVKEGELAVLKPGREPAISTDAPGRFVIFGGEPMDGPRLIWWNFVSSSRERLVKAREDWIQRAFPEIPGDNQEFIPAPDTEIPRLK